MNFPMAFILSSLSSDPTLAGMPQQLRASTFKPVKTAYVCAYNKEPHTNDIFEVEEVGDDDCR